MFCRGKKTRHRKGNPVSREHTTSQEQNRAQDAGMKWVRGQGQGHDASGSASEDSHINSLFVLWHSGYMRARTSCPVCKRHIRKQKSRGVKWLPQGHTASELLILVWHVGPALPSGWSFQPIDSERTQCMWQWNAVVCSAGFVLNRWGSVGAQNLALRWREWFRVGSGRLQVGGLSHHSLLRVRKPCSRGCAKKSQSLTVLDREVGRGWNLTSVLGQISAWILVIFNTESNTWT